MMGCKRFSAIIFLLFVIRVDAQHVDALDSIISAACVVRAPSPAEPFSSAFPEIRLCMGYYNYRSIAPDLFFRVTDPHLFTANDTVPEKMNLSHVSRMIDFIGFGIGNTFKNGFYIDGNVSGGWGKKDRSGLFSFGAGYSFSIGKLNRIAIRPMINVGGAHLAYWLPLPSTWSYNNNLAEVQSCLNILFKTRSVGLFSTVGYNYVFWSKERMTRLVSRTETDRLSINTADVLFDPNGKVYHRNIMALGNYFLQAGVLFGF